MCWIYICSVSTEPEEKRSFLVFEWALVNSNSQRRFKFCDDGGHVARHLISPSDMQLQCPGAAGTRSFDLSCPSIDREGAPWLPYIRERSLDQRFVCYLHRYRDCIQAIPSDKVRFTLLCARRLAWSITAVWQHAQTWMQQARDLSMADMPEPSFPTHFRLESQFLGLSGGSREYYDPGTLLSWLDQCYSIMLDWHAFSRMAAFKIIDAIATRLGAIPPHYPVDEFVRGVVYINDISPTYLERRRELIRHGVPVFDIITRTPFFDHQYPPSPPSSESEAKLRHNLVCKFLQHTGHHVEPVWFERKHFPLFRPKTWVVGPLSSGARDSLWEVVMSNCSNQLENPHLAPIPNSLVDVMRSYAPELEQGFHPLAGPLSSEDKGHDQVESALGEYVSIESPMHDEVCQQLHGTASLLCTHIYHQFMSRQPAEVGVMKPNPTCRPNLFPNPRPATTTSLENKEVCNR